MEFIKAGDSSSLSHCVSLTIFCGSPTRSFLYKYHNMNGINRNSRHIAIAWNIKHAEIDYYLRELICERIKKVNLVA
ncbi:hypothetical protein BN873_260035 [Candidatus Competibacter denitrificans Run_A_D11]|jgi:hypothetical protein|uniref:Uncharacterized protein n=1 Tax=Candidatus Competibacter denitrificans Run_A_D11 TaxID=1400863 RepID=W6M6D8_9GAMM|nr:hypothetical protein [Candidatus Competibacter denitrificans]CDI02179.1 hypothetical protein BN873_260035 [Candidatus Competibacter denitrificans Run_A_D11]